MFGSVFRKTRSKITHKGAGRVLIMADKPNWAYDTIARALVKFNRDPDLTLDIEYFKNGKRRLQDIHSDYDLIFFLGWQALSMNDQLRFRYRFIDKKRILTGIHSHHAWDGRKSAPDKQVLPPQELVEFLSQFAGVNAVSRRLYELFLGAGLNNLTCTQNGVDGDLFTADLLGKKKGVLRLGFSGNDQHDWRKGLTKFISPAADLDGVSLKLAVRREGYYLTLDQMPSFYKDIDVYICASLSEGFSLSVLEAAASGCPVISTRVGGCEDLIIDGVNGFLVNRNVESIREKIVLLRDDPRNLAEMGRMSRQIVEQLWSWEIRAPAWLAFIKSRL